MCYNTIIPEPRKGGMDMPVTDKVKAAMAVRGKRNQDLAKYLGITNQSLSNKFNRGSFSAEDLIKIADFIGASLTLEFEDNNKISFSPDDIR